MTSPQRSELSMMSERWDFPPEGLHGGLPGSRSGAVKIAPDGTALPRKGRTVLEPGDMIRLTIAGGAGFGPPGEREVERVIEDLRNEIISADTASSIYGLDRRKAQ